MLVQAAAGTGKSHKKRGHMQPMGMQQEEMEVLQPVGLTSPADFYERFVAGAKPVLLAGAATAATRGVEWTRVGEGMRWDRYGRQACRL